MLPLSVAARRAYLHTDAGKIVRQNILKEQAFRFPEKYKARHALSNAVRDRKIIRTPCVECGNPKVEGHHEDYSKPLEVVWLCNKHHRIADKIKKERDAQCQTK
jgi:hypothetical protein